MDCRKVDKKTHQFSFVFITTSHGAFSKELDRNLFSKLALSHMNS